MSTPELTLQSCNRMLLLADYRFEEGDLFEAASVLNEALLSLKQADTSRAQQLKIKIYLKMAACYDLLKKHELAAKYAQQVLYLKADNPEALELSDKIRKKQRSSTTE